MDLKGANQRMIESGSMIESDQEKLPMSAVRKWAFAIITGVIAGMITAVILEAFHQLGSTLRWIVITANYRIGLPAWAVLCAGLLLALLFRLSLSDREKLRAQLVALGIQHTKARADVRDYRTERDGATAQINELAMDVNRSQAAYADTQTEKLLLEKQLNEAHSEIEDLKQEIYDLTHIADLDPPKRRILGALDECTRLTAGQLEDLLKLPRTDVDYHLEELRNAKYIEPDRPPHLRRAFVLTQKGRDFVLKTFRPEL
jgi:DNA-binding MarR family transcriptional regulator